MLNELYTFAEPVQVVPFSSLKWGKFTLLHTSELLRPVKPQKKAQPFGLCLASNVVIRLGFEPKTHSLEGCCSIQLSYRTDPCLLLPISGY